MPDSIKAKMTALDNLVEQYPDTIPIEEAARFLGITPRCLRAALVNGTAPFGLAWQSDGAANRGYAILTHKFYAYNRV